MKYDYLIKKDKAAKYLSEQLNKGTINLFLGAGVSIGMGLPNWIELVNNLYIESYKLKGKSSVYKPVVDNNSSLDDLQIKVDLLIKEINDKEKFHDLLEKALYPKHPNLNDSFSVLRQELLIAIGGLVMGSKRGHVQNIITLNFDNIIEWYLGLHGFVSKTIYELPKLEGNEDARIYHPNGFIPHPSLKLKRSNFTVLGLKSVNKRLGDKNDYWFEKTRHLIRSGICLFVGMSERTFLDKSISSLITSVGEELNGTRPIGIWIINGKLTSEMRETFLDNNVIPLEFDNVQDIPKFIIEVCQRSAVNISMV